MQKFNIKTRVLAGILGLVTLFATQAVSAQELDPIEAVFGNLISDENSVLPLTAMLTFLIFVGFLALLIVYFGYKQKWNITSLAIPLGLITVFALTFFIIPIPQGTSGAPESYDYHISVNALISPWTFNITLMDGFDGNPPDCDVEHIEDLMTEDPKDMSRDRAPCNDIDNSLYNNVGIEDLSGVKRLVNVDVPFIVNRSESEFIVLAITLVAFDTEHGFIYPIEENPDGIITDFKGESIELILAQRKPHTIYVLVPNVIGLEFLWRCSFFCGAGHFGMTATINVVAPLS